MVGKGYKGLWVIPLAQEKEAINSEIVSDQLVDDIGGKFFSDILFKERRMAPNAITLAVADVNRQGNSVRYLLDDHGGHLGNVFNHILVFST